MKLGSKDVAYSSLDLDDPSSPQTMRRNTAGNSSSSSSTQSTISSSSSSATVMDSMESSHAFFSGSGSPSRRTTKSHNDSYSALHETIASLEGPIRQLTVEVKGALLATGCV